MQIIVETHLNRNTLRCVQNTVKTRVVGSTHRKINFKVYRKENRQGDNIVFPKVVSTSNVEPDLEFLVSIT